MNRYGDIIIYGEYHAMDDNGYYCGWRNFRFSVRRSKRTEHHALTGPCAGKWQVTRVKGRPYLMSFVGGGDARDYLYESVSWPLADQLGIHSIDGDITVDSEQAAREYR